MRRSEGVSVAYGRGNGDGDGVTWIDFAASSGHCRAAAVAAEVREGVEEKGSRLSSRFG